MPRGKTAARPCHDCSRDALHRVRGQLRAAIVGALGAVLLAAAWVAVADAQDYVPGRVLVRWKPQLKSAARSAAMAPLGASRLASYEFVGVEALAVPGMDAAEAAARLSQDPRVEYAEPDYIVSIGRVPDDPRYPEQFGLHNTGQTGGLAGSDIGAERAWDLFTGDPGLLIADIDSGCDYDHEDLAANIWTNPGEIAGNGIDDDRNGYVDDVHGYDFYSHDGDPRDDNGHGTHTAGTIAAVGNNGLGVTGVVWRAKLVILKFLNSGGSGPTSGAVEALGYCVRNGIRLSNNSWNGGFYSRALEDAIIAAGDAGHLFIAAAGNARTDTDASPSYPGALPEDNIISVAATDHADQLAAFSNFGLISVDLAAPGFDVLSTFPNNRYGLLSGTSMAAPHVTGAAAFLMGRFPDMPIADVKARLLSFADPKPGLIGRCVTGGRMNLALASADPDSVAPAAPQALRVSGPGSNSIELSWIATGDDSTVGTASQYELRVATQPITAITFGAATRFAVPRPSPVGTAEVFRVRGLAAEATYHVALRARDEFGNPGPISNVVSFTTLPAPTLALPTPALSLAARTGTTLTRTVELRNPSPGVLEWAASQPTLDFDVPAGGVASAPPVWPAEPSAKGAAGSSHEPQTAGVGGPDAGGYRWIDSDESAGPVFQWVDIVSPENAVTLAGDEAVSARVPVGFSFPFYGRRFTQLRVCTNGYLQFGNEGPVFVNVGLPGNGAARNLIAPFWDDLNFGTGVKRAYLHFDGARTIVTWDAVPRYNDAGSVFTFQAILYPSGEVRFQYRRMIGTTASGTIGLQDSTRSAGTQIAFNQAYVHDSLAVRIVPLPQWLDVSPRAGLVAPGGSQTVTLTIAAAGLASGNYEGRVRLLTNDGVAPDTAIRVSMAVEGAPDLTVTPAALEFGAHFTGARDTLSFTLSNVGVDPLHVSSVTADHAIFEVANGPFTLLPGDARALPVVFAPTAIAEALGHVRVASDDPDQPVAEIAVHGVGSAAPVMELVTARLDAAAAPTLGPHAASSERGVVLRNPGGASLTWTASAFQGVIGARPAAIPVGEAIAQVKGAIGPGPSARGDGGPDAFGYRWIDSDAPSGPAFEWAEVAGVGRRLFGSADDSTTRIALPFPFEFYGVTYDSVAVCTNGWLSFTSRDSALVNADLPNASPGVPRALVAPLWTDLDLRSVRGPGRVFAHFDGSRFIVEWKDVVHFSGAGPYTFQAILSPGGAIDFQYLALGGLTSSATIGLQDAAGAVGLRVVYNAPYVHPGLRVRLTRQDDWLKLERASGSVPPGAVDTLRVQFDARQYVAGDYAGEIRITSNDVTTPLAVVPCALHVGLAITPGDAMPGALAAISRASMVRFAVVPPAPGATLAPGSLEVDGVAVALAAEPTHDDAGRLVLVVSALDLLRALPNGSSAGASVSGEAQPGGWFRANVPLVLTPPGIVGGPIPAFADAEPTKYFRGHEAVDLAWVTPAGGADRYEVAYSADGGARWAVVGHRTNNEFGFIPPDTTSRAMLEIVALTGDAVVATWLSAPFIVDLEAVGAEGDGTPGRFAFQHAGAVPARGPVVLALALPQSGQASIDVFDIRGARVRTLHRGPLAAGRHRLAWDGRRDDGGTAAPGVYLVQARTASGVGTLRVALIR